MAEQLSAINVRAIIEATLENELSGEAADDSPQIRQGLSRKPTTALANGTGAGQVNRIWTDETPRSLAAGATETIDVFDLGALNIGAGAGRSALGQAIAFARIVGLLVHVTEDSPGGTLRIEGDGAGTAWNSIFGGSDSGIIGPIGTGGWIFLFNPTATAFPVADTTNHLLDFTEAGGALGVEYEIVLLGST